jgi:hypothetical protein
MMKRPFALVALLALAATSCDGCKKAAPQPSPASLATRGGPPRDGLPAESGTVIVDVQCGKMPRRLIDPHLFGVAFADERADLGARAHRWGGNTTSRYNFVLGNAWSTGADWFYRNVEIDPFATFVGKAQRLRGRDAWVAVTVPMIGWVAKDTTSGSFPVSRFGTQQKTAPERPDLGNGLDAKGKPIAPGEPTIASVAIGPDDVSAWVARIEKDDADGVVHEYILDNEPSLWSKTHRDVHPAPETYDELLEKTLAYARAIRKSAPNAIIAGPAEWGWPGYFYSGKDAESGLRVRPDRRVHGDVPKLTWYMRALAAEEKRTGEKLVDVIDVHFYPQADGVQGPDGEGGDGGGDTDPATNARRLRATRALWDEGYVDESYIKEAIALVPRVRALIAQEHPRVGLQIGEFNFGGERDISGALALAEALGRMAEGGVQHAFYWKSPKALSPAFFAMRAFCDYDGAGASFSGELIETRAPVGVSAFAAQREDGKLVVVLLSFDDDKPHDVELRVSSCADRADARRFEYDGSAASFRESRASVDGGVWRGTLERHSLDVIEVALRSATEQ